MIEIPLSVLELALVEEGRTAGDALAATTALARRADELGYRRVWVAEHHGADHFASVSPPVLTAHLAGLTTRIRVGSGGVLARNHAPYEVAEHFTTLAVLHPGRIDLGIGRGAGTFDDGIAAALRRGRPPATEEDHRRDVAEVLAHLSGESGLQVLPGEPPLPQPWLLASSASGAEIAASLGLPLAFAHHIRPDNTFEALDRYRTRFTPSRWAEEPRVIVAVETLCAETGEEAERLGRPGDIAKVDVLTRRAELPFRTPEAAMDYEFPPGMAEQLAAHKAMQAIGSPGTVRARLSELAAKTGADELMLVCLVYDPAARIRSLELVVT